MTVHMVTESVDAFVKSDLDLCRKVIDDDDKVDQAFNEIKEELANQMDKSLDVKVGLDLLMAAKYMERIGDHAVNIAEWVEYSITGVHRNNEHQLGRKLRLTKKIFKSSILASVIVLIIGMACVLGVLYRHFGGQIINEPEERSGISFLRRGA